MEQKYSLNEILEYVSEGMTLGAVSEVVGRDGVYTNYAYYGVLAERCAYPYENVVVGTVFDGEGKILADVTREFPRDVPIHDAARTIGELWLSGERDQFDEVYDDPDPDHYYDVDAESKIG